LSIIFYKIVLYWNKKNVASTRKKFDIGELKTKLLDYYDKNIEFVYAEMGTPVITCSKPMSQWLTELFYQLMHKMLLDFLSNGGPHIPVTRTISSREINKWTFQKQDVKDSLEGEYKLLAEKILREGAEKILMSLKSQKVWVELCELQSENVKEDVGLLLASDFCVVVHLLKRKLGYDLGRESRNLLNNTNVQNA